MTTLRNAYESLQESVAEREAIEKKEKARLNDEIEMLRQMNDSLTASSEVGTLTICRSRETF